MTRCRWLYAVAVVALGCSTGEGEGDVTSERLFVEDCWDGPFDLAPTFFGINPAEDHLLIRVQRGSDYEEVSDGLILVVDRTVGAGQLGRPVEVGLPPGVTPPGVPPSGDPNPPLVSLSLYLHDTCHLQNKALYSIGGTITFDSLFSGDPNEDDADARLTEASFDGIQFADPRDLAEFGGPDGTAPSAPGRVSEVSGWFRFFFQRGQPAQPFP